MYRMVPLVVLSLAASPLSAEPLEHVADLLAVGLPAYAWHLAGEEPGGRGPYWRSLAATGAITVTLKQTVDQRRPNGGPHAFPSGHTAFAFQGATFIHRRHGLRRAVPAYVAATLVGYSRIATDHHDLEDVLAGAALGMLTVRWLVEPTDGWSVAPWAAGDGVGVAVAGRW